MTEPRISVVQDRIAGGNSSENVDSSPSWRNALLCALVVGACLLVTYPIAETGFIDDWSYTKTALDFLHTGHFLYNGWATAMLGWQVVWGALIIKLFGFSFTIVRLSMLPIAMASVYLFHQILVRFGIAPRLAVFGTLTLGLSPLFVPLAASFMTDVPGLFAILLCIWMCQRALAARTDHAALLWLFSAALLNMAGGTVRQISWLGALLMVPSTAWLLRKRRGVIPMAIVLWLAAFFFILACQHWLNRQPYAISEGTFSLGAIDATLVLHLPLMLLKTLLCQLLVLLPVLIAWLPGAYRLNRWARIRIATVMIVLAGYSLFIGIRGPLVGHNGPREDEMMPWLLNILGAQGMLHIRSADMLGSTPITLGVWARLAISLVVVLAGLSFTEQMLEKKRWREFSRESMQSGWREVAWLLGPFFAGYFFLLLPRALHGFVFDRYLLPPMAVLIVALLKLYQQEGKVRFARAGWFVLIVFACFTVGETHDWFARNRARAFAADEILAAGVPRTAILGGFDYDGWTQVQNGGHINMEFLRVPAGAYNPNVPKLPLPRDCQTWYINRMPKLKPEYFLSLDWLDCLAPSKYAPIGYGSWLPPYHQKIYIQEFPHGSK